MNLDDVAGIVGFDAGVQRGLARSAAENFDPVIARRPSVGHGELNVARVWVANFVFEEREREAVVGFEGDLVAELGQDL